MRRVLKTFVLVCAVLVAFHSAFACRRTQPQPPEEAVATQAPKPPARVFSEQEVTDIKSFIAAVPEVEPVVLDEKTATSLVALPLACIGRPHDPPRGTGYLYEVTAVIRPDFLKTRAFFGCFDWHSAVNSTWAMTRVHNTFPDRPIAKLIRENLKAHLSSDAMKGELEFFNQEGNKSFERPYGWAWLLRLYTELKAGKDKEMDELAANMAPLVKLFSEGLVTYLDRLVEPMRIGTHANTAFTLRLILDYGRATGTKPLEDLAIKRARQFFEHDTDCGLAYEPSGADFFSPCLEEASLMAEVFSQEEFVHWFDSFMPPVYSRQFRPLTETVEVGGDNEDLRKTDMLGAKSHLIGLAVIRARAMEDIAHALPQDDPRVAAYRKLATFQARSGSDAMFDADYHGTHWIATFIIDYLVAANRPAPAPIGRSEPRRGEP